MRTVTFASDARSLAALGQGTWKMGINPEHASQEIAILQEGLTHGLQVIDTAAMYADGGAEQIVGQAIRGQRERAFVVSKVWPTHADRDGVRHSLEASLKRLGTPYLDLFLLHWPSARVPLKETMQAMANAFHEGQVKAVGVSNFSVALMEQAQDALRDVPLIANQVEYSLFAREAETRVIPYCQAHNIVVMAYSPVKNLQEIGTDHPGYQLLHELATQYHTSPYTVALAWAIRSPHVIAIPKTANPEHLHSNEKALTLELSTADLDRLDAVFPASGEDIAVQYIS
ncbi:aldo/keto reductase [Sulfobacillus sp. hq2]|uniref:NADP-dependent oxidoreductase domain-containing protein n=1 Tax=Sulfobacillus thermotolerans TaxID=338644 RepID=A0ABM6RT51_9FIRM|nr:aldo/keto reductase [Sulfobacillus sp. hq2]AUW94594.1 hypothetical protein BXT84_12100 [Sulfobacillus thermotolerans]MCY0908415.1 aldo/keto reductase [Sulfobacillus thermotolerans]